MDTYGPCFDLVFPQRVMVIPPIHSLFFLSPLAHWIRILLWMIHNFSQKPEIPSTIALLHLFNLNIIWLYMYNSAIVQYYIYTRVHNIALLHILYGCVKLRKFWSFLKPSQACDMCSFPFLAKSLLCSINHELHSGYKNISDHCMQYITTPDKMQKKQNLIQC